MSATIESLGVSVAGKVTRRYDDASDRTTIAMNEQQCREMYDALAPVLEFFDRQPPLPGTEVIDATKAKPKQ